MKQLFLLRHGQAAFSEGSDFQRSLTQKGIDDLKKMGKILSDRVLNVDIMYCSSAQRTIETSDLIKNYIGVKEEVFTREIYEGDLFDLLTILENAPFLANSCLLVGHNPAISLLLAHLTQESYFGLQPGMMAAVELEINQWSRIGEGSGALREILK
jgi:phosphohistidine phosphatase